MCQATPLRTAGRRVDAWVTSGRASHATGITTDPAAERSTVADGDADRDTEKIPPAKPVIGRWGAACGPRRSCYPWRRNTHQLRGQASLCVAAVHEHEQVVWTTGWQHGHWRGTSRRRSSTVTHELLIRIPVGDPPRGVEGLSARSWPGASTRSDPSLRPRLFQRAGVRQLRARLCCSSLSIRPIQLAASLGLPGARRAIEKKEEGWPLTASRRRSQATHGRIRTLRRSRCVTCQQSSPARAGQWHRKVELLDRVAKSSESFASQCARLRAMCTAALSTGPRAAPSSR